eukprot:6192520-Pleurochrysis_carterae.AAC.5
MEMRKTSFDSTQHAPVDFLCPNSVPERATVVGPLGFAFRVFAKCLVQLRAQNHMVNYAKKSKVHNFKLEFDRPTTKAALIAHPRPRRSCASGSAPVR